MNLVNKRILVTGGTGFIGKNIRKKLIEHNCEVTSIGSKHCDLRDDRQTENIFQSSKPEIVIHLAALVGGIYANMTMKGQFLHDNLLINTHVIDAARRHNVEKLVLMGSGCIYPRITKMPIKEEYLWEGYPEETNAPYAMAKRIAIMQSMAYKEQYGLNSITIMPGNVYGPYDQFHPDHSHVVPALIRKFVEATETGAPSIDVWGTGTATRDFIFSEDLAEITIKLCESYDNTMPINVSKGEEVSIQTITEIIKEITSYKGEILWNSDKPDGQPRRAFDTYRLLKALPELSKETFTPLYQGLEKTIKWYKANKGRTNDKNLEDRIPESWQQKKERRKHVFDN